MADPEWPIAPSGLLTLRGEQIEALAERRTQARRQRMVDYMRDVAGDELAGVPDWDVHAHVLASERSGEALGIETEAGHSRWAYLMYATRGRALQDPELLALIRSGGAAPDEQVKALMAETIKSLRARRLAGEGRV